MNTDEKVSFVFWTWLSPSPSWVATELHAVYFKIEIDNEKIKYKLHDVIFILKVWF